MGKEVGRTKKNIFICAIHKNRKGASTFFLTFAYISNENVVRGKGHNK